MNDSSELKIAKIPHFPKRTFEQVHIAFNGSDVYGNLHLKEEGTIYEVFADASFLYVDEYRAGSNLRRFMFPVSTVARVTQL